MVMVVSKALTERMAPPQNHTGYGYQGQLSSASDTQTIFTFESDGNSYQWLRVHHLQSTLGHHTHLHKRWKRASKAAALFCHLKEPSHILLLQGPSDYVSVEQHGFKIVLLRAIAFKVVQHSIDTKHGTQFQSLYTIPLIPSWVWPCFRAHTLDAMPSDYNWHPLLRSLFTGAVEAGKSTCFSHGTASAQPLGEEDGGWAHTVPGLFVSPIGTVYKQW